ncbi:MAG: hypothetical protein ACREX8_05325, partial [Gammaproteobacteria bacterium]
MGAVGVENDPLGPIVLASGRLELLFPEQSEMSVFGLSQHSREPLPKRVETGIVEPGSETNEETRLGEG